MSKIEYAVGSGRLFTPSDVIATHGHMIKHLKLTIEYIVIDKRTAERVFFPDPIMLEKFDPTTDFNIVVNGLIPIKFNKLVKYRIDKELDCGYGFKVDGRFERQSRYILIPTVTAYSIININNDEYTIDQQLFHDIIREHFDTFNNAQNKPAKALGYHKISSLDATPFQIS